MAIVAALAGFAPWSASAGNLTNLTMVPGGGPVRWDCLSQLAASGEAFPAGRNRPHGVTCMDGDVCDADGERNGACEFVTSLCTNLRDNLPRCKAATVTKVRLKGRLQGASRKEAQARLVPLSEAGSDLGLPSESAACTARTNLKVDVRGPDKNGEFRRGMFKMRAVARAKGHKRDRDTYRLVCLPASGPPAGAGTPGAGLVVAITGATVDAAGQVSVTFSLTDDAGVPITPTAGSTDDPNEARLRFTLAYIEPVDETSEGFTTTFTRYRNYITSTQKSPITGVSSDQPTYDSGGTFETLDPTAGLYMYTFGTMLPAGYPATWTHTVGAQVEREYQGETHVANPLYDFVPSGAPVTTVRQEVTTAECNSCHGTLALHGGGRREVGLCQLCHTDQAIDPDTGNTIDFKIMVHKIHRGKDLPSIQDAVGAKYEIIGFQQSEHVYAERVKFCKDGFAARTQCTSDADCPASSCVASDGSTIKVVGVGFPQDIRNCAKCHSAGATAAAHLERPSTATCTTCHDKVNPGETTTAAGPPGTGHTAGAQPEALCRLCHTATGEEWGLSVGGAHTVPELSAQLPGIQADILGASGAPSAPVTVTVRVTDGAGTPLLLDDLARRAYAISGPTTDLGGASVPRITGNINAPFPAPDATGAYTVTTATLPADATGSWRIGFEFRNTVTIKGKTCAADAECDEGDGTCTAGYCELEVEENAQNPIVDFSVDGSPLAPRRVVVDQANCGQCHGTFSRGFDIHGGSRNRVDHCVICHNANVSDYDRRRRDSTANPVTETIHLKAMLHRIHTGEELAQKPFIIYGFGSSPAFTPNDFGDILYPRDRRDCAACHVGSSYMLPLPTGLLPTAISKVDPGPVETVTGSTPPTRAACNSCHDSLSAGFHAATNTTGSGDEACLVCHGEGRIAPVSASHAMEP